MLYRFLSAALMGSMLAAGGASAADVGGRPLYANLAGTSTTDPDGTGTARVTVNQGQDQVCWKLTVSGIEPATAAHIHLVATGAIVVGLSAPTDGESSGCTSVTSAVADALLADPDAYYINVHNAPFPGGAVEGRLSAKKMK